MNKAEISLKFQQFEDREDVKEIMRTFTVVLAQMYEKQAIGTPIPEDKAANHILEEFDIDNIISQIEEIEGLVRNQDPKI